MPCCPTAWRASPGPPAPLPEGFRVMFAGNVGAAQDFPAILAAAERLKDHPGIHWIVLGGGRMLDWVKGEVTRRGLERTVHLLGQHPADTMPGYFAQADLMLVTLRREPVFALTIPGKWQAYLACGRPIVAMLDGKGARIVEEAGAGLACPAGDAEALAGAVLRLYRMDRAEREAPGAKGLAYSRSEFAREALIGRLEHWKGEAAHPGPFSGIPTESKKL